MTRCIAAIVTVALLAAGCSGGGTTGTATAEATLVSLNPDDPTAPTSEALAANEGFLVLPSGYADCGTTVLTSGWPTTTTFNADVELACLNDAMAKQAQSQYVYWGRDGTGGITGVIIRVNEGGPITYVDYTVDASGSVTSNEQVCADLQSDTAQLPVCSPPPDTGTTETTTPGRSEGDHTSRDRTGGQSSP